jgi:SAM-dependent methyltransferase
MPGIRPRASTEAPSSGGPARAQGATSDPSPWVVRFAALVPPASRVLDIACGRGRHARLFAGQGCMVDAVDVDATCASAFENEPSIAFTRADLENGPWPYRGRQFDAIVVTHYLHRALFAILADALAPGGLLIYETFAVGNERYGKPTNAAFLLKPRELIDVFGVSLHVLAYEEGVTGLPRAARIQRLAAVRPGRARDAFLRLDADR